MKKILLFALVIALTVLAGCGVTGSGFRLFGNKLQYSQSFDLAESIGDFEFSDISVWTLASDIRDVNDVSDGFFLQASGKSQYKPEVRSPGVIAMLRDRVFGDFVMEADLSQTGGEYAHRDMCVFFGIRDATHFYYAHIATAADEVSHMIHIVDGADRRAIATSRTEGVQWGENQWHKVRVVRKMDGPIEVYFDDLKEPIMSADDNTFMAGYVGFGSFDDAGKIDNIKIYAKDMLNKKSRVFENSN